MATVAAEASSPRATAVTTASTTRDATLSTKRKRVYENGVQPAQNDVASYSRSRQLQQDLLELIRSHDTEPSILDVELAESPTPTEPAQKKARLSDPTARPSSIRARLEAATYASLQAIRADVGVASKRLMASLRAGEKDGDTQSGPTPIDSLKKLQRVETFTRLVYGLLDNEEQYDQIRAVEQERVKEEVGDPTSSDLHPNEGADKRLGTVLTLFGNAPTPKQLFSSAQRLPELQKETDVKSELPVEEMSLPNGLMATKLLPAPVDEKKAPTFEDTFAPPYSLTALQPPKANKRATTRDTVIKWEFKSSPGRGSKQGGYTVQSQEVGSWLDYGRLSSGPGAASPSEKRKQRERALSGGESTQQALEKPIPQKDSAEEEEALFRRAFSSFAPSCDNTRSLVSVETKNMVWWQKAGEKRFMETFALDPALHDAHPPPQGLSEQRDSNVDDFSSLAQDQDELEQPAFEQVATPDKTNLDWVLRQISQLLETLASHQRIRNAALPSSSGASRTPISPAPLLTSRAGKPDLPAEEELTVYHSLRRELAYLILKLPPYAVAKLDGDQLAELGVSRLIKYEGRDVRGTMEDDQVARQAKYSALATQAGIATLTRGSSSTSGQHYSTTAQRTPAIGQAAQTRYGQTAQYNIAKTPATTSQYQRSTTGQSQYGTPGAAAQRAAYGQPQQYSRSSASQPLNGPLYPQQRPQQVPSGYGSYNQQHSQQSSQPQQRAAYSSSSSQPLAQYQPRQHPATQNSTSYQSNSLAQPSAQSQSQTTHNRSASPAKGMEYAPQAPAAAQRPAYISQASQQYAQSSQQPGSGRATPNYPSQPPTPVNGFTGGRPPPPAVMPRPTSATPQPGGQGQVQQAQMNGYQ